VIALAGLGKVVVKALGGAVVEYPTGTRFFASADNHVGIIESDRSGYSVTYSLPPKTVINYPPDGAVQVLTETVLVKADWRDLPAATGPVDLAPSATQKGRQLIVPRSVLVTQRMPGSSWGTFTIALTIPIALFVGLYMYKIRKGRVFEASIVGGVLTLGAVYLGSYLAAPGSWVYAYHDVFNLTETQITAAMAVYGFVASVLPVWLLLCPRDYLSSFLKIGTVALLVLGVIIANPQLHAPALNHAFIHGGPVINGSVFPFVFIVIMCGAISGFHSLVSSGTTPKMIKKESDARVIGYGAMLMEGLVGIVALIAAAALPNAQYYQMNTPWEQMPAYQAQIEQIAQQYDPAGTPDLKVVERQVGETLAGRTGGAVTLAVGMARIFDDAAKNILGATSAGVRGVEKMIPYWYHFAIMFEALFILTTIDTGTRVGRFLLQETFGKVSPRWGRPGYWPSAILSTALIVAGWWYFINANSMTAIWPMFGIANQLLAVMALVIATAVLVKSGRARYAWVTLVPAAFVTTTTMTAAYIMLAARVRATLIVGILVCTVVIMGGALGAVLAPPRVGPPGTAVPASGATAAA
jgi:carbon starvation protein